MGETNNSHFDYSFKTAVPVDIVYKTVRDDVYKLAAYLPNIVSIKPVERKTVGDKTYIINSYQGKHIFPDFIGNVVKLPDMSWLDRDEWLDNERVCNWRYEPFIFKEYIQITGMDRFTADGTYTTLRVSGEIHVNFLNYPLIPVKLKDKINDEITGIINRHIFSNFSALIKAIEQYAADNVLSVAQR